MDQSPGPLAPLPAAPQVHLMHSLRDPYQAHLELGLEIQQDEKKKKNTGIDY